MHEYHRLAFLNGLQEMTEKHLESVLKEPVITVPDGLKPEDYLIERKKQFAALDLKALGAVVQSREPAWQLALMDWLCCERLISAYEFRIDNDRLTIMIKPVAECRLVQVGLKGEGVSAPPPQN